MALSIARAPSVPKPFSWEMKGVTHLPHDLSGSPLERILSLSSSLTMQAEIVNPVTCGYIYIWTNIGLMVLSVTVSLA